MGSSVVPPLDPINFQYMDKHFFVLLKKVSHAGLEQHEGKYVMTEFSFLGKPSL